LTPPATDATHEEASIGEDDLTIHGSTKVLIGVRGRDHHIQIIANDEPTDARNRPPNAVRPSRKRALYLGMVELCGGIKNSATPTTLRTWAS